MSDDNDSLDRPERQSPEVTESDPGTTSQADLQRLLAQAINDPQARQTLIAMQAQRVAWISPVLPAQQIQELLSLGDDSYAQFTLDHAKARLEMEKKEQDHRLKMEVADQKEMKAERLDQSKRRDRGQWMAFMLNFVGVAGGVGAIIVGAALGIQVWSFYVAAGAIATATPLSLRGAQKWIRRKQPEQGVAPDEEHSE